MGPYNFLECKISSFLCFYATKLNFKEKQEKHSAFYKGIKGAQQIPDLINVFNNLDNKLTATALDAQCRLAMRPSKVAVNQRRNLKLGACVCCLFQCEGLIALPTAHLDWNFFRLV